MKLMEFEVVVKKLNVRVDRIEEILPTLATKADLTQLQLATREDLAQLRVETKKDLAQLRVETKKDLDQLRVDTKKDLTQLRVDTKEDLAQLRVETKEDLAQLRVETKEDLAQLRVETKEDLAQLRVETREDLAAAVEILATKAEVREEGERTRRHFDVVAERLEGHIRLIAEGHVALKEQLDEFRTEVKVDIAGLDRRLMRLEAR